MDLLRVLKTKLNKCYELPYVPNILTDSNYK